jgi:hypothetical protein
VLDYNVPGLIGKAVDALFIRWLMTKVAVKGLGNLKSTLESAASQRGAL